MISRTPPTIERPHSVNSSGGCTDRYAAMYCILQFLHRVLRCQSSQSILVYNISNMHAMSHSYDFFACSCSVNIYKVEVCFAVLSVTPVFRVGSNSIRILTAMSDSKSLNTSLLEVIIPSKDERVFIRDLSDLTLQIILDVWWDSRLEGAYCLE